MICVIHAHPYLSRSHTNRALADALRATPDLELRSLYDLYPDFDIDVAAEQRSLAQARLVVWMHPVFWYSVPALFKHWFDKVLTYGWAYGEGGTALHGKHCLWVPTTGGDEGTYVPGAMHALPFASFAPPLEQTARFCGMHWQSPHIVYGAIGIDEPALAEHAATLLQRLASWRALGTPTPARALR
jgi:glutathione-regulated potassium-efflux system ancillary protein KefF